MPCPAKGCEKERVSCISRLSWVTTGWSAMIIPKWARAGECGMQKSSASVIRIFFISSSVSLKECQMGYVPLRSCLSSAAHPGHDSGDSHQVPDGADNVPRVGLSLFQQHSFQWRELSAHGLVNEGDQFTFVQGDTVSVIQGLNLFEFRFGHAGVQAGG